jgi:hypothetical protein
MASQTSAAALSVGLTLAVGTAGQTHAEALTLSVDGTLQASCARQPLPRGSALCTGLTLTVTCERVVQPSASLNLGLTLGATYRAKYFNSPAALDLGLTLTSGRAVTFNLPTLLSLGFTLGGRGSRTPARVVAPGSFYLFEATAISTDGTLAKLGSRWHNVITADVEDMGWDDDPAPVLES